jgi:hypothetical protein
MYGWSRASTDGYALTIRYSPNDAARESHFARVFGRRPTMTESWLARDGGAEFLFGASVVSRLTIHFASESTVEVWCPFVLDPRLVHTIKLTIADRPLGPIVGTLRDNTLHFSLPAFAVPPNAAIAGEIDAYAHLP